MMDQDLELELIQSESFLRKNFWEKHYKEIPYLKFKSEWDVKIIPPMLGALIRFAVRYKGKELSIYLDVDGRLGCVDQPYWEIYPDLNGEPCRVMLGEDIIGKIDNILNDVEESDNESFFKEVLK